MTAKKIRNEVVKEVSELLERIQAEESEADAQKEVPVSVAGNIHREKYRKFWLDRLKPDAWTVKVVEEGYKLPFLSEPTEYFEEINKSAREEAPFLKEEVVQLQKKGVVKRVKERPHCCSPLTVACRKLASGKVKCRLCLDLSRKVNKHLKKEGVKLATLQKSFQLLEKGDFQATYDLSSAYHHIKIHPDHKKYLGFSIPGEGGPEYYQFECMPFGLASATKCLARMTKPICALLAKNGIRHSLYIDDEKINAPKHLIKEHLQLTLDTLKQAGFVVASSKTDSADSVSTRKGYLGFVIDSQDLTVHASEEKLEATKTAVQEILDDNGVTPTAKQVASVLGKILALEIATGPIVQLQT